jgi:hypothetical protein
MSTPVRKWLLIRRTAVRTLPLNAPDEDIKRLVVEWSELLAQKRFQEALGLFLHRDGESAWTAQSIERVINGYGVLEPERGVIEELQEMHGVKRFEITTLLGRPDADEIIRDKIHVDRENLYGLNREQYVGMVHYFDVPLCGERSDLTARFNIKRVGTDRLTLEFEDLHVL